MKDRQPWSVRGVSREARAKAARAAAQQHMTIGEWVTRTLITAADRDLGLAPPEPSETSTTTDNLPARPAEQQRELTHALGSLVRYLEKNAQTGDVSRRLERTEHVLMGRIEQMAAGLYSLMQTMENRTMPVVDANGGTARLISPDQSRLAAAVEKVVDAEARRQDQMAAVAEALTLLAARVGDPQTADVAPEPAVEPQPETASKPDIAPESDDEATLDEARTAKADPSWQPDDELEPLVLADEVSEPEAAADTAAAEPDERNVADEDGASDNEADKGVDEGHTSPAAATAAWMADWSRDGGDVVANIRARRLADQEPEGDGEKRGFFGRMFRRD